MARFAHISDVHLGSWNNHPDLREYPLKAWEKAVDRCIEEAVDFVIIAGDFFDTSLPSIDVIRKAALELRRLKEAGINVYAIAGSHDFSPTGKSMLNVLEDAGLLANVGKIREAGGKIFLEFTEDRKTGARLCGVVGRRGALERSYFENLDRGIENEKGRKIFVFHSGISENLPENFGAGIPLSLLPKGFEYYASGHIHAHSYDEKSRVAFPGPLFPADFHELERYDSGFYIVDLDTSNTPPGPVSVKRVSAKLCDVCIIKINADGKMPAEIQKEAEKAVEKENLEGKILLMKIEGTIDGKTSDINLKPVIAMAAGKGALSVKKNMKITSKELGEILVKEHVSTEEMEMEIVSANSEKMKVSWLGRNETENLITSLMSVLKEEKQEDESSRAYEERIKSAGRKILGIF
ncbi:MAG: DNA repair exonuclease [Candidatus Aenigmarchaeota archaeon]|nr:DNA repair exonuclease [Candidatus Aenigmarchaeota archaeon]